MGITHIQYLTEVMCRERAWEKIKLKCKICGEIIAKGYPRLLAHTTSHYTTAELLYNEEAEQNIIMINFESSKTPNEIVSENGYEYPILRCKICRDSFIFKKEEIVFSELLNHIKSHYIDKDLVKKEWIAKDIIHLNYDSVIQVSSSDSLADNINSTSSVTYRELTKKEGDAYKMHYTA